jgi:hypothetical protein
VLGWLVVFLDCLVQALVQGCLAPGQLVLGC